MTITVREWLPQSACTEDAVRRALAGPVAAWGARWFALGEVEIASVRIPGGNSRIAQSLQVKGKCCDAELSGRAKRALLETALQIDFSGLTLMESDHRILDAFATEAISDLLGALDGMGDGGAGDTVISIMLALDGKELAVVTLSSQALIPAMKAALGRPRRPQKVLRSRVEALRPVTLVAQGVLGYAELTLEELKGLVIGDVVILDNSLKSPVELRLSGIEGPIARGKLVRTNNQVSIQF